MIAARAGALVLVLTATAAAEPPACDRTDAKALLQSGLKMYAAKDFLGALVVFKDAHARCPSAKILLNIGTTLRQLDRKADAANAYQRYLDASDADPTRRAEVTRVLADLDRAVGVLELSITPPGAELQLGDGPWVTAAPRLRVAPGSVVVHMRAPGHDPAERTLQVATGTRQAVAIALLVTPAPAPTVLPAAAPLAASSSVVHQDGPAPARRSRLAAIALVHVDPAHRGAAALIGLSGDLTARLQLRGAALLGRTAGVYAGASYAVLTGRVRPTVSAGVPMFVSNGARFAVRGAAGIELAIDRHIAVIAELGVERVLDAEMGVAATLFVPALGVAGRL